MEQWNFYVSGILYDKFFQEDEKIMISKLDVYSGKWQEKTLFSESESENLKKICHRDILSFFKRKKDYEEKKAAASPRAGLGGYSAGPCGSGSLEGRRHAKLRGDRSGGRSGRRGRLGGSA